MLELSQLCPVVHVLLMPHIIIILVVIVVPVFIVHEHPLILLKEA
jgi:hypothetical protein